MIKNNHLVFNIIYTPNTVVKFLPFVKTLLKNTPYNFRLVSNGCSIPERKFLKIACCKEERLEYLTFPSSHMESHGLVLNYLQAIDKNRDYFCFIDSDIFAAGKLTNIPDNFFYDSNLCGFFSGAPVWLKKSELIFTDNLQFLAGYYHWNEDMLCHGSSYFAIYKNEIINSLIQDFAIGFEMHEFSLLSKDIQEILMTMNIKKIYYDTAKVLNLLLIHRSHKLIYQDIDNLLHIGSSSFHALNQVNRPSKKRIILEKVFGKHFSDSIFNLLNNKDQLYKLIFKDSKKTFERRNIIRKYFSDLIIALQAKNDIPDFPVIHDNEIKDSVERASRELIALYS